MRGKRFLGVDLLPESSREFLVVSFWKRSTHHRLFLPVAVYHVKFGLPILNGMAVDRNRQTKRGSGSENGSKEAESRKVDPYLLQQRIVIGEVHFLCFRCLLPL